MDSSSSLMQFQIETDDTNSFRDELNMWRTCDATSNRPPPLVVELFLDLSTLTRSQSLVIVDGQGKHWDVSESLNTAKASGEGEAFSQQRNEVILERWTVALHESRVMQTGDYGSILPTVYKKCIVFFRSLYATTKFLPAWRFVKSLSKSGSPLRVKCRVVPGGARSGFDALTCPLYDDGDPVTTDFDLGITDTPAGQFSGTVTYRNDCNLRIDDSETLLSSRFMGADEQLFKPSLRSELGGRRKSARATEPGSLPVQQHQLYNMEPSQAYGSMSTFHGNLPVRQSSPISVLRAAKTMGSDEESLPSTSPVQRPLQLSRAALTMPAVRRPSISFQPFKAGSLSSSPGLGPHLNPTELLSPQSPRSVSRSAGANALLQARNRSSLTAGMPATLRGGPPLEVASPSTSSSPKPAPVSRYSSSFSHRRSRSSYGGGASSKVLDDDQNSSGKQSVSSSLQPGSGMLAEGGTGGSSGSLQTDDDNISDFLKMLDSKKTLKSFERSNDAAAKKTGTQLMKFQMMRDSHTGLAESMTSSALMQRSSSSSSRQLSSVPPMVAGTSASISSSPGKPVSPHTPHTPAIPSRLSAGLVAEYSTPRERLETLEDITDDEQAVGSVPNAIDIPLSPRPRRYYSHVRRSSSVAQREQTLALDEDFGDLPFGIHRSMSLGADDREPPSLSILLGANMAADMETSNEERASPPRPSPSILRPAPLSQTYAAHQARGSAESTQSQVRTYRPMSLASHARASRLTSSRGRGGPNPQPGGSESNLQDHGSGSGSEPSTRGTLSRTAAATAPDFDDELLFNMSELGRERRSIDEARGGYPSSGYEFKRGHSKHGRGW